MSAGPLGPPNPITVTIYVPAGYKDADEFLRDCQFEPVDRPAEAWTITCRNKWRERISFAWALLFQWPRHNEERP